MPDAKGAAWLGVDAVADARALRRRVFELGETTAAAEFEAAEAVLQDLVERRLVAEKEQRGDGAIVALPRTSKLLGPDSTGIDVAVDLRMAMVPTALIHLFNSTENPLVQFQITNQYLEDQAPPTRLGMSRATRRKPSIRSRRKSSFMVTVFAAADGSSRTGSVRVTGAHGAPPSNVLVEDLDARTELHRTAPIWLRRADDGTSFGEGPRRPGTLRDLTRFLGAFVTPNCPDVMSYVRKAVEKHPKKRVRRISGRERRSRDSGESDLRGARRERRRLRQLRHRTSHRTPPHGRVSASACRTRVSETGRRNCIDATLLMASLPRGRASLNLHL